MALQKKTTHKGLDAPKAYAVIKSLYTVKTEEGYETTANLEVYDTDAKENLLYCASDTNEGRLDITNAYEEIKKKSEWKGWKDV